MHVGFWTDLQGVQLNDSNQAWIQLMPLGAYTHPLYGKLSFTPEKLDQFKKNFDDRVRGTDIDIDYDHKEDPAIGNRAAGWLRQVVSRGADGLWGLVEWTKSAAESIRNGEYRYFSPEFADEWKHPQTGETHKNVIFGGGITNRPFLKDILPINMTEMFGHTQPTPPGGRMDWLKKLVESLGLKEGASEEDVISAITKLSEDNVTLTEQASKVTEKKEDPPKEDDELKKLAETSPALAKMLAEREEDHKRLTALEASTKLSDVKLTVVRLNELGAKKDRGLAKTHTDALEEILVGAPAPVAEKVTKFVESILEGGLIELGEKGTKRTESSQDVTKKFSEAVKALTEGNKELSYADACSEVSRNNPDLWNAYNDAVFADEGADR